MFHKKGERGQGLVEYALILVFIAIVVVAALGMFGIGLGVTYYDLIEALPF